MSGLTPRLGAAFADAFDKIRKGELRTLVPFLCLFRVGGRPMDLKLHYQFAPLFNTVQSAHTVYMCGRQLGKSYSICSSMLLRSMLIPYYHTLVVQPRADQIQRLIGTVYKPLLSSCPVSDAFIAPAELAKMSLREFANGSLCYAEHMYDSADRVRGVSGAATLYVDESHAADSNILLVDSELKSTFSKRICEIKRGDFIASFKDGCILVSSAEKDASFHGIRPCYRVVLASGAEVVCTSDHSFQTAGGRARLSDILEDAYEREHDVDGTAERGDGESSRGRLHTPRGRVRERACGVDPQLEAGGLRGHEAWPVARVLLGSSKEGQERRLRGMVGEALHVHLPGAYQHLVVAAPWGMLQEDRDEGVPGHDNAPDSAGLVVHGRRVQDGRPEQREHSHERVHGAGGPPACRVAEGEVGRAGGRAPGDALEHREDGAHPVPAGGRICKADGPDTAVCVRLDEIQDGRRDDDVRRVRVRDAEVAQGVLLPGVRGGLQEGVEEGVCGGARGLAEAGVPPVEGRPQGGAERGCARSLRGDDAGAQGAGAPVLEDVAGAEPRGAERLPEALEGSAEGGPGLPGEAEAGARGVLPAAAAGPGAPRAQAGAAARQQEARRRPRAGSGVPEEAPQGAAGEGPGEAGGARRLRGEQGGGRGDDRGGAVGPRQRGVAEELLQAEGREVTGGAGRQERQDTGDREEAHGGHTGGPGETGEVEGGREAAPRRAEGEEGPIVRFRPGASPALVPIVRIEYAGELPVYDIEVSGTHSYVLANGVFSYNCQDIEYEFLDIAAETMSASLSWGFSVYTGTPKTTDTTLALLWNRSSQAEWVIRCTHCGYFNIPNPEHDIVKMLGKEGPVCAKCGKPVDPCNGGFVHAIPERARAFPGYHVSQTVHPLHTSYSNKWERLLDKVEAYSDMTCYNEVYGWPYDSATAPLTLADLEKACHGMPMAESPRDIENVADLYRYVTVGVDWGGGGAISDSYTAYAVLGLRRDSDAVDVLYGKRIRKGVSPSDEASEVLSWITGSGADAFAYDNGGAGFARLEIMKQAGLLSVPNLTVVPVNYVSPRSGDVMRPHTGQRERDLYYYSLDKSRSLAVCIQAIKSCRIRFPQFREDDQDAVQRDFLALREDPSKSARNETVILIGKKPGVPDDFAHAVNFGCSQIWDHFGAYPRIGSRYDTSALDFDGPEPLDDAGPRGDFNRFQDAVDMRVAMMKTGGSEEYGW